MIRPLSAALLCAATFLTLAWTREARCQEAYGGQWGHNMTTQDWNRFYHYPYVYYPQNFWGNDYYRSSDSLYYRYPPEMQIPVYNKQWHNEYPASSNQYRWTDNPDTRRYHWGHQFILDVF
jgi:hypothetical protein